MKKSPVRKAVKRPEVEKRIPPSASVIYAELNARTHIDKAVIKVMFQELAVMMDEELFGLGGSRQFLIPEAGFKILNRARPATEEREMRSPATGEMITVPAKGPSWKLSARFMKRMKEGTQLMDPPTKEDF